jgi:hypothetical protein
MTTQTKNMQSNFDTLCVAATRRFQPEFDFSSDTNEVPQWNVQDEIAKLLQIQLTPPAPARSSMLRTEFEDTVIPPPMRFCKSKSKKGARK